MTLELPLFMQENKYAARVARLLIESMFTEGILDGFAVSQRGAGANMSVDVTGGVALVDGDDQSHQHTYLVESTATENLTGFVAPGANSRIDLVVLKINDTNAGGSSGDNFTIQRVTGSPSSSPVPPSVPASAIPLAEILVASNTTAITDAAITDVRARAKLRYDVVGDENASRLGVAVATPSTVMRRTSDGRSQVEATTNPKDIANKQYVDNRVADGANIGTRTINANRLIANSITASEIGPAAVNTGELVNGAVTTAKIADGAVTEAKMAALASGASGNVHYSRNRGIVTVSGELANNAVVVLPAGYRPSATRYAGGVKTNGPDAGQPGWVSVAANGNVSTTAPGSSPGTGVGFTISFPAA